LFARPFRSDGTSPSGAVPEQAATFFLSATFFLVFRRPREKFDESLSMVSPARLCGVSVGEASDLPKKNL
jgi:hypothetical protein